jgi:hypothetical protein
VTVGIKEVAMSKLNFVCIDCSDPHKMADFWSAAMDGYTVNREEWGVTMSSETGPNIYFEVVPEGKAVKNRLHLNLAARDGPAR